ncbi:MAG: hypothetical protein J6K31_12855 [Parabacteroides sp.]|nr:hypothetical protein [Parabacteroides sp.]
MKALILSFFAVILGYSLIFNEKGTDDRQPVLKDSNSVYVNKPVDTQIPDSVVIYRDKAISVL